MKCQILFSKKNKENIINLSSAESVHSMVSTPQPLYNTIVGVQSINHVSYTTVFYPNKNV